MVHVPWFPWNPRLRLSAALGALCVVSTMTGAWCGEASHPLETPLAVEFAGLVAPRLVPPADAIAKYARALDRALDEARMQPEGERFVVAVDRSANVQALLLWWGRRGDWRLVGASPVSTGLPGSFDHFATPLGVFDHSVENPDFRAEGTQNELGIRGYGRAGARVYDFGWVTTVKGWGDRRPMAMRLQMHATDPDWLEQRLGTAQSKGCIRISASLNEFIDRFGVLDEDYEAELAYGRRMRVLRSDRTPTAWSGRTLVVVDSRAPKRPAWASTHASAKIPAVRAAATPGRTADDGVC